MERITSSLLCFNTYIFRSVWPFVYMKCLEGLDRKEEGSVLSLNTNFCLLANVGLSLNLIIIIPLMFLRPFSSFSLFPG